MTTRTYSIFDPHAVGPNEEIQQGGTVATCQADAQDYHRLIRGTIGFSSGRHKVEMTAYGEGDLPGKFVVGIVTDQHPLSMYVGEDGAGFGFKLGDGDIWSADTSVDTVAPTSKKVVVSIILDADADTVTFEVNGSEVATVAITAGQTWYYAVSVGSTVAYDLSCVILTDPSAFTFPDPDGIGWFTTTAGFGIRRVSSAGFLTASGDTPANTAYAPDIIDDLGFGISRTARVWVWAAQNYGSTYGSLELDATNGDYDFLLSADPRDSRVTLRLVPWDQTFADSIVVGTAIVDSIKTDGESKIRGVLSDTIATIRRPLQTRKFPPYVDEGAANRPLPIIMGGVRNVPLPLIDEEERIFQGSDRAITNVGALRDGGDALDPNGTPPDYTPTPDFTGVQLAVMPVGKLTGDFSSIGAQSQTPGVTDVLNDAGLFTIWTNPANPPDGWSESGVGNVIRRGLAQGMPQDYVAELESGDPWLPASSKFGQVLTFPGVLKAGKTYNLTFKVRSVVGSPPFFTNGLSYGIRIQSALDASPTSAIWTGSQPIQQPLWFGDAGYFLTYTVPAGADRDLHFVVSAATSSPPTTGVDVCIARFYGIRLEELGNTVADIPLQGMSLTDFCTQIIETRAGLTSSDWVAQDTIDIDEATGYRIGYYTQDPVTIEDALRAPLDSYCAVLFTDHLGRIRIRRLIDPDTIDDGDIVMELSGVNCMYPINCEIDPAEGLTTAMGARKNYFIFTSTDFVSDTTTNGVTYAQRAQFSKDSQFIQTATAPLASFYNFARDADPVISLFDLKEHAQTEIDRVVGLYERPRHFYTLTVYFNASNAAAMAQLIFGDGVRLTYPRYGLDAGKKLLVVDWNLLPSGLALTLRLWG